MCESTLQNLSQSTIKRVRSYFTHSSIHLLLSLVLDQQLVDRHRNTWSHVDLLDLAFNLTLNQVLHLHCLDREELLALGHDLANLNSDGKDSAGHGREDTLGVIDLLGRRHVSIDLVLSRAEDSDLNLVALDGEVVVDLLSLVLELDELALTFLVETDERAVLEIEVGSRNSLLLTCCELGDLEATAGELLDLVVDVVLTLLDHGEDNVVLLGCFLTLEDVVVLGEVVEIVGGQDQVLNVFGSDRITLETVRVPGRDEGGRVVALIEIFVSQD